MSLGALFRVTSVTLLAFIGACASQRITEPEPLSPTPRPDVLKGVELAVVVREGRPNPEMAEEIRQNLFTAIRQAYPSARVALVPVGEQAAVPPPNKVTLEVEVAAYSADFSGASWVGTTAFTISVHDTRATGQHRASGRVEDRKVYGNTWGYASAGSALRGSYAGAVQKALAYFEGALAGFAREEDEAAQGRKLAAATSAGIESFKKELADAQGGRQRLRLIRGFLDREYRIADAILEEYAAVWSTAIETRRDFDVELLKHKARLANRGTFTSLGEMHSAAKTSFLEVKSPPEDLKMAYETALDYYATVAEAVSLAESPSGSLLSFRQKRESLASGAKQKSAKLDLLTQ